MEHLYPSPPSLQQYLRNSLAEPEYIQVTTKGFKEILRSTVEFLETYQIQANLFVKLPSGATWQGDICRYGQTLEAEYRVVCFVRPGAPPPSPETSGQQLLLSLPDDQTWRGDYFLIVQGAAFAALLVAHRPPALAADGPPPEVDRSLETGDPGPGLGQNGDRIQSTQALSVCCSIHPGLVANVMGAIRQQVLAVASADGSAAVTDLLNHWSTYCPPVDSSSPTFLALVDRWIRWQFRTQELLRQSVSTYRRQASGLSSLSSQNEVLIKTLRLKDEFLNTIGQELRTPLTTIKTALTLLDSSQVKPGQRQRYMDMISHECDRQSALISGVLNLLQMETDVSKTPLAAVNLAEVVPPVVSTYQPLAAERGIMLAYTIPSQLPPVTCPDSWLRQIMIHLLNNSLKYTASGGEVWVTAQAGEDGVEIDVRDTGSGIAASDLPNIFNYFYRGRNLPAQMTEGAGLGLSIVQQLLMFCGGAIEVKSQPGQGTIATVKLPLH
ncbi:MAG TPA: histidine kinase [Leptolyngbyaceae cyanobacterium M65_K2018_010]|nr:histidine kinase [Leptolyngbyaceae cyanobacterium M65_K2018_010]